MRSKFTKYFFTFLSLVLLSPLSLISQSDSQDCSFPRIQADIKPTCRDLSTGRLDLRISEGTPPYRIVWQDGSSRKYLRNIEEGEYTVQVTDVLGCVSRKSFTVSSYRNLTTYASVSHTTKTGKHNGSIDIQVEGGVPPYYFTWISSKGLLAGLKPGLQSMKKLPSGDYKITVYDTAHCYSEIMTRIQ